MWGFKISGAGIWKVQSILEGCGVQGFKFKAPGSSYRGGGRLRALSQHFRNRDTKSNWRT